MNPMPASAMQRAIASGASSIRTPRADSTSAAPERDESARLPCFATGTPAPATMKAAHVEILKEPDRDQSEMTRCVAEPKKRDGSNDAGADEQDRQPPAGAAENKGAGILEIENKNNGERNKQDCFDKQARDRGGAGLFSE